MTVQNLAAQVYQCCLFSITVPGDEWIAGQLYGARKVRASPERYDTFFMLSDEEPLRIPITDVFDLHSVPPRDIVPVIEEYLAEARRLGLRALRIIHGRGIGVQRERVRSVLARTNFVEAFSDAPAEAGGWGATIVTLKRE